MVARDSYELAAWVRTAEDKIRRLVLDEKMGLKHLHCERHRPLQNYITLFHCEYIICLACNRAACASVIWTNVTGCCAILLAVDEILPEKLDSNVVPFRCRLFRSHPSCRSRVTDSHGRVELVMDAGVLGVSCVETTVMHVRDAVLRTVRSDDNCRNA